MNQQENNLENIDYGKIKQAREKFKNKQFGSFFKSKNTTNVEGGLKKYKVYLFVLLGFIVGIFFGKASSVNTEQIQEAALTPPQEVVQEAQKAELDKIKELEAKLGAYKLILSENDAAVLLQRKLASIKRSVADARNQISTGSIVTENPSLHSELLKTIEEDARKQVSQYEKALSVITGTTYPSSNYAPTKHEEQVQQYAPQQPMTSQQPQLQPQAQREYTPETNTISTPQQDDSYVVEDNIFASDKNTQENVTQQGNTEPVDELPLPF
ncbi:hypothetical protein CQA49_00825 [Helicobacter sp. MIT 00-7814]|uniref:hypothetical protein n=1 Tax=unclassified Helicobacter TaxID=2593540 RepID=UPI000E1EAB08|nr:MULTISPECIES: hypothetical protein [unclassified Helicobacter]RDU55056.1 hypothetical protein CQA37_04415 [Helicobacter sp. MIT 99-10781]RDU56875.1 hypothetical protein CQA49_00825 [Helicobacter sp. MIT 00-7814]